MKRSILDESKEARALAIAAHGDQKYGDSPYIKHLEDVQGVVRRFGFAADREIVLGAWLHDTLEDTKLDAEEIRSKFGAEVLDIVTRVTDMPGSSRKERKAKTYPKIKGHLKATIVKLCDRIANVEASRSVPEKMKVYSGEQLSFSNGVSSPKMAAILWAYLGELIDGHAPESKYTAVIWDDFPTPPEEADLFEFNSLEEAWRFAIARARTYLICADKPDQIAVGVDPFKPMKDSWWDYMTSFGVRFPERTYVLVPSDPTGLRYPSREDLLLLKRADPEMKQECEEAEIIMKPRWEQQN